MARGKLLLALRDSFIGPTEGTRDNALNTSASTDIRKEQLSLRICKCKNIHWAVRCGAVLLLTVLTRVVGREVPVPDPARPLPARPGQVALRWRGAGSGAGWAPVRSNTVPTYFSEAGAAQSQPSRARARGMRPKVHLHGLHGLTAAWSESE